MKAVLFSYICSFLKFLAQESYLEIKNEDKFTVGPTV